MDSFIAWDEFLNKELSKHVSPTESELRKQSLFVQFDPLLKRSPLIKDPKYVGSESEGSISGGDNVFETPKQKLIDFEYVEVKESINRSSPSIMMMNMDDHEVDVDGRSSIMIPSHQPTHTTSYADDEDPQEEIQKMEEEKKIKRREREREILRMEEEIKQLDAELENPPDNSDVVQLILFTLDVIINSRTCIHTHVKCRRVIKECEREADVILEKAELDLNSNKQMVHESTSDCISSNEVLENYRKKTKNVVSLLKNKNQVENLLRGELDQNLQIFAKDLGERNKVEMNSKEEDMKFKKETNDMMAMEDREILALESILKKEILEVEGLDVELQETRQKREELTKMCDELIAAVGN
uniref:transforming acidic coiled-coil-containing protein 3-like isoform X1 n=1 Tax=Ciona intestinalis TaxID=7719 RepID=UPI000EF4AD6E|nr:transforming acidic coiled-coil-containing protein 3-like isoform X1 [Ciona intestinalis]|eukprot:XP_026690806.1 transforming acidic coiled-coil-containing protein 3-like isoform X1 [Ciona intestinalis]